MSDMGKDISNFATSKALKAQEGDEFQRRLSRKQQSFPPVKAVTNEICIDEMNQSETLE